MAPLLHRLYHFMCCTQQVAETRTLQASTGIRLRYGGDWPPFPHVWSLYLDKSIYRFGIRLRFGYRSTFVLSLPCGRRCTTRYPGASRTLGNAVPDTDMLV